MSAKAISSRVEGSQGASNVMNAPAKRPPATGRNCSSVCCARNSMPRAKGGRSRGTGGLATGAGWITRLPTLCAHGHSEKWSRNHPVRRSPSSSRIDPHETVRRSGWARGFRDVPHLAQINYFGCQSFVVIAKKRKQFLGFRDCVPGKGNILAQQPVGLRGPESA
jgi:hypothetical protein